MRYSASGSDKLEIIVISMVAKLMEKEAKIVAFIIHYVVLALMFVSFSVTYLFRLQEALERVLLFLPLLPVP